MIIETIDTFVADTFVYDNASRLKRMERYSDFGHSLRADFAYNAAGQFTSIDRYSDLAGTSLIVNSGYAYDNAGRLTELSHTHSGTNIARYRYGYDKAGRITDFDNLDHTGENADLTYDRTNQLLTGDRTGTTDDESYGYDAAGNRASAGAQALPIAATIGSTTMAPSPTRTTMKGTG